MESRQVNKSQFLFVLLLFLSLILPEFSTPTVTATEDSWKTLAPMPTARSGLGMVSVNGKIYAIGGENGDVTTRTNEEYDPETNTWTTRTSMPTARSRFAIAVYQNKIYVIGGTTGSGDLYGQQLATDANEVYDPSTDTWETRTPLPTPRQDLSAQTVNGKIYTLSGIRCEALFITPRYDVTEVYDPATDSWTTKASIPTSVWGYASTVVDNKIYVIGGWNMTSYGWSAARSNQVYDPKTDTWISRAAPKIALARSAAGTTTGDIAPKRIYILGGMDQHNIRDLTQVYNPETNVWSYGKPMPTVRFGLGVAVVNDTFYAIGGSISVNVTETAVAVNERYTPLGFLPPYPYILSPKNITYNVDSVELIFTLNETFSLIRYSLNDQSNMTISGNVTISDLDDDVYTLRVYAKDTEGNWLALEPAYFSVDTTLPVISDVVQEPLANVVQPNTSVLVNATIFDELSGIKRVTLKYSVSSTTKYLRMTNLGNNLWSYTIPEFPEGEAITYAIVAEDNAGNTITTEQMGQTYEYQVIAEFSYWAPLLVTLFALMMLVVVFQNRLKLKARKARAPIKMLLISR
jgi:N-acetylneuraminic acid mutarotase